MLDVFAIADAVLAGPREVDVGIEFTIPGPPCAKGRPRMAVIAGHAHAYTPEKTARYKNLVALAASSVRPATVLDEPLSVSVTAYFPRPKRLTDTRRDGSLKCGQPDRIPHTSRPDADNVAKAVLDGLNSAGIWRDDSLIARLRVSKWYVAIGQEPRVEVVIGGAA